MNCQIGDICMFRCEDNAGRLVRIVAASEYTSVFQHYAEGQWWYCEALTTIRKFVYGFEVFPYQPGQMCDVPDSHLRPLRDPGEDAQDETLSWLPVPLPELV